MTSCYLLFCTVLIVRSIVCLVCYCDLLLSHQLLPAARPVSGEFVFPKMVSHHIWHAMSSDIDISQGSVATRLRCGGVCNDPFIANFLLSVTVKEL